MPHVHVSLDVHRSICPWRQIPPPMQMSACVLRSNIFVLILHAHVWLVKDE
jgi:hypothetical protein